MTTPTTEPGPRNLLLTGIGSLVTNDADREGLLGVVESAAVAIEGGKVEWAGTQADLPARYSELPRLECGGRAVVPGFVDPHTHLVFAGHRADEFARRLRGETYEEILAAGGGILSTVAATRSATGRELFEAASARALRMLASGTTTVEVKSGYGLDVATERTMLEVAIRLDEELPIDVVATFLGAHVLPVDFRSRRDEYVDLVVLNGPYRHVLRRVHR